MNYKEALETGEKVRADYWPDGGFAIKLGDAYRFENGRLFDIDELSKREKNAKWSVCIPENLFKTHGPMTCLDALDTGEKVRCATWTAREWAIKLGRRYFFSGGSEFEPATFADIVKNADWHFYENRATEATPKEEETQPKLMTFEEALNSGKKFRHNSWNKEYWWILKICPVSGKRTIVNDSAVEDVQSEIDAWSKVKTGTWEFFEEKEEHKPQGQKSDNGKPRFSLVPPLAQLEFVKALTEGASRPERCKDDWRQVKEWRDLYTSALGRHLNAWERGEFRDSESGLHHLAHAMCCLAFMLEKELEK